MGAPFRQLLGQFKAVQLRHRDIEDGDIGQHPADQIERRRPGERLPDHLEAGCTLEQGLDPRQYDRVIVSQSDADCGHGHWPAAGTGT
jgi:hypothetical protein